MIKAIETQYKGYRFRSRLEARWAVFFDALCIEWQYEPEGFDMGGVLYLPDFFIPHLNSWIEIKPIEPSDKELNKVSMLAESLGQSAYLFYGQIRLPSNDDAVPAYYDGGDYPYFWCECQDCGMFGIEFDGRSDRLSCKESYWSSVINCGCAKLNITPDEYRILKSGCPRHGANHDKGYNYNSPRLTAAYRAAMQARFEHGETP
jgi:hypothetical protein